MKVDQHDIKDVDDALKTIRSDSRTHLNHVQDYLDHHSPPGFEDKTAHILATSHLGRVLANFAQLQMWIDWRLSLTAAIDSKGDEATMGDIISALSERVCKRAATLNTGAAIGPLAHAYSLLVTEHLGNAINTCKYVEKVTDLKMEVCTEVAPTLGLTTEECFEKLRARDDLVTKLVAQAAMLKVVQSLKATTGEYLPVPEALAAALGINPEELPSQPASEVVPETVMDAVRRLGLDPKTIRSEGNGQYVIDATALAPPIPAADIERRVPRFPPSGFGNRPDMDGIKVG